MALAFSELNEKTLIEYIKSVPALSSKLGNNFSDISVKEVGDGNLNFVYIVANSSGSLVIKQALPYVRLIGESWKMTKERAYFESLALREEGRLCPEHVPEVYHFDRTMSLIGMLLGDKQSLKLEGKWKKVEFISMEMSQLV